LPAEVVSAVERSGVGAVSLSLLPPLSTRDGRYLCRSLHARFPDLPIVVGIWQNGDPGPLADRFRNDGGAYIVAKLSTAVKRIRQCACAADSAANSAAKQLRVDRPEDALAAGSNDAELDADSARNASPSTATG
jgi:hypothetical protein